MREVNSLDWAGGGDEYSDLCFMSHTIGRGGEGGSSYTPLSLVTLRVIVQSEETHTWFSVLCLAGVVLHSSICQHYSIRQSYNYRVFRYSVVCQKVLCVFSKCSQAVVVFYRRIRFCLFSYSVSMNYCPSLLVSRCSGSDNTFMTKILVPI